MFEGMLEETKDLLIKIEDRINKTGCQKAKDIRDELILAKAALSDINDFKGKEATLRELVEDILEIARKLLK